MKELSAYERKAWADYLDLNEQYLYQCLTGRRDMNPIEARRVEEMSNGFITRRMLCQKTWLGIWPELVEVK